MKVDTEDARVNLKMEPCCAEFNDVLMMNDIRQGVIQDGKELFIWWDDGDCTPLRFCPCCGKRLEVQDNGAGKEEDN